MSSQTTTNDPTFRKYTPAQAQTYSTQRGTYTPQLYQAIYDYHKTTPNSSFTQLLDLGTGPGNAARDLATSFSHATATDPGESMITVAKSIGGNAQKTPIAYHVCTSEDCDKTPNLPLESVDIITAAMAAHWFNFDLFYKAASRILKPGGTVAFWCNASLFSHPKTRNAEKVNEVLLDFEHNVMGPYQILGNRLCRGMYRDLPLPWTIKEPVEEFDRESFVAKYWNEGGKVEDDQEFFSGTNRTTVDQLVQSISTASMCTRWREAHPDHVDTERDPIRVLAVKLKEALGPGTDELMVGSAVAMLLMKKTIATV